MGLYGTLVVDEGYNVVDEGGSWGYEGNTSIKDEPQSRPRPFGVWSDDYI